jgi:uncharacterized protein (DUF305 family)
MNNRRTILSAVALAATALVLSACSTDHASMQSGSMATMNSTEAGSDSSASTGFNTADAAFAQNMIPHHEQAIEMAEMALDPTVGASDDVRALADAIRAGQDPEIQQMRAWLEAWGQPEMGEMEDHDMSSMVGMMSMEDMDALATLTGAEFDRAWLEMMILHHEGAVEMAEAVKADGANADVVALADQVIAAQTAEIATMNELLAG